MSRKHPIIAVTGSSGAGTSTVKNALEHIFHLVGARAAFIEGDSFHRYERKAMAEALQKAKEEGRTLSHFVLPPVGSGGEPVAESKLPTP